MTTDLTSYEGKLPRGLAKETVGSMKRGDDVIMSIAAEPAIRAAARYMGLKIGVGKIWRVGGMFYRGVILGEVKEATP